MLLCNTSNDSVGSTHSSNDGAGNGVRATAVARSARALATWGLTRHYQCLPAPVTATWAMGTQQGGAKHLYRQRWGNTCTDNVHSTCTDHNLRGQGSGQP